MNSLNMNNNPNSVNELVNNQLNNLVNNESNEAQMSIEDRLVKYSFYVTYCFLITTATITFIEAMRNKDTRIRHVLNLETCISVVAAFFYGVFMKKINVPKINYKEINVNRYMDWSITTPIMLLVLLLAFGYNTKKKVTVSSFFLILVLNYAMLAFGFMGENNLMNKKKANIVGFIFFALMYYYIYVNYIAGFNNSDNLMLYVSFLIFWGLYGVVYWAKEKMKNVGYNVLDLFSKCFVGIFFWAYFTKAIVLG